VVPGALVVLGLAVAYALFGESSVLISIFYGIKAAVIAIIFDALIKIARRSLKSRGQWILACLGFIALFFFALPFPIVVLAAAVWGFYRGKSFVGEPHSNNTSQISFGRLGMTVLVWSGLWFAPIFFLWVLFPNQLLTEVATFFSTLAITSFGGAYAVLAYVAQEAVSSYNWLTAAQMMDGLGLAETTPGPLILVTEFVGFMAGFTAGGITLGIASAAITLWVTFVPCFLWIFAGAPFIEVIATRPSLASALASITAVIVGVILNLSVWFALHVFFGDIEQNNYGPIVTWEPTFRSFDGLAAVLVIIAVLMIFALKQSVLRVLLSVTLVSMALMAFN
jgi:chromate transporter